MGRMARPCPPGSLDRPVDLELQPHLLAAEAQGGNGFTPCTHECTGGALLIRRPVQPCASTATETANRVQRTWLPKYDKYIYK